MFTVICTLAVLFLIAKKNVNNDGVSIFCIIAFLITGIALVDILNIYGFFAVVLPILLTVILMVLAVKSSSASSDSTSSASVSNNGISESDPAVEALIREATEIINDFLEVGLTASLFTTDQDFRGHITVVADARPPFNGKKINYGFYISLNNVDNLSNGKLRYPKLYANNPDQAIKLDYFLSKYQNCYNASNHSYELTTRRYVLTANRGQLQLMLSERIKKDCPLADYSSGLLYTKNVYRC